MATRYVLKVNPD